MQHVGSQTFLIRLLVSCRDERGEIFCECQQTRFVFARGRVVYACGFCPVTPGSPLGGRTVRCHWKSYSMSAQGDSLDSEISDVRVGI